MAQPVETNVNSAPTAGEMAQPSSNQLIRLDEARWKLARIWLIMGGLFVLLLIGQSVMGKYVGKAQNVWSWAIPTIMPTLSLIITVLGAGSLTGENDTPVSVKKSFFVTVYLLSFVYLFLVLATVLVEPFTPYEPLELLNLSNFWLGPFQGLVASSMAVLFFSNKAKGN